MDSNRLSRESKHTPSELSSSSHTNTTGDFLSELDEEEGGSRFGTRCSDLRLGSSEGFTFAVVNI